VQETCARDALQVVRESFNEAGHEHAGNAPLDGGELPMALSPSTSGVVVPPQ
jgi:hypothetical protein